MRKFSFPSCRTLIKEIIFLLFLSCSTLNNIYAAPTIKEGVIIRDAEIESILKEIIRPIFKVAGLNPNLINLYIVSSPDVNAAASLENSIFINTGLITKAEHVSEVIGVLAHETGHIALGHIVRLHDSLKQASLIAMASMALGAVAAIAGAGPEALMGGFYAGQSMAMGALTHYTRGQEASADQAAIRYLNQLNWSTDGLVSFMKQLARQEYRSLDRQNAYMRTHPLSSDRVNMLENSIKKTGRQSKYIPSTLEKRFQRLKLKIIAYTTPPRTLLKSYPLHDQSNESQYIRSIAYYRDAKLKQSINQLSPLIKATPKDPFLHELKGQIYFEMGRILPSLKSFEKAISLRPQDVLIQIPYVQASLESKNPPLKSLLKRVFFILKSESKNPFAWKMLAIIYGRLGKKGMMALALAEKELTLSNSERALRQAKRALSLTNSKLVKLRANDIILMMESAEES